MKIFRGFLVIFLIQQGRAWWFWDSDPCDPNPCKNGGKCTETDDDDYKCMCRKGFTGGDCDIKIAPDPKCDAVGGTCKDTRICGCKGGLYRSGLCNGVSTRKCCVPQSDPKCDAAGGTCKYSNVCDCTDGEFVSRLCNGPPARKCCVPDEDVKIAADPKCDAVGGTCKDTRICGCEGGLYRSGLCNGVSTRKCCVPQSDPKCNAAGGTCKYSNVCDCTDGEFVSRLCNGPPARKCCVPDKDVKIAPDPKCDAVGGTCKDTRICGCEGGLYRSGLCNGVSTRKCCVPQSDPKCDAAGGTCKYSNVCDCTDGEFVSRLCNGPPARKCCVPDEDVKIAADPKCDAVGGTCKDTRICGCEGGLYRSGLCNGVSTRKCCVPQSDPKCDAAEGTCKYSNVCGCTDGEFVSRLCNGPPARKCCVPDEDTPCDPNPCQNNGVCTADDDDYTCTCAAGFSGDNCSIRDAKQTSENGIPGGDQPCYKQVQNGRCLAENCCPRGKSTSRLCPDYPVNYKCCSEPSTCSSHCGTCSDSMAKDYACRIMALYEKKQIKLKPDHVDARGNKPYDGASVLSNVRDTCYGLKAKRSNYCSASLGGCVCLSGTMLKNLYDYAQAFRAKYNGQVIQVNSLAGSCHSSKNSHHYRGTAFDIACKTPRNHCTEIETFCRTRKAIELCYPGSSCGGHDTWVHCVFS